jgi:hypothetical protein
MGEFRRIPPFPAAMRVEALYEPNADGTVIGEYHSKERRRRSAGVS